MPSTPLATDPLTGLPGRTLLTVRIERAWQAMIDQRAGFAVLAIAPHDLARLREEHDAEAIELGLTRLWTPAPDTFRQVRSAQGYFLQGDLDLPQVRRIAEQLLTDPIVEFAMVAQGTSQLMLAGEGSSRLYDVVWILPKPGVMDPVAESALRAVRELGVPAEAVRTFKKIWVDGEFLQPAALRTLCAKSVANDAIEQVVVGPLARRPGDALVAKIGEWVPSILFGLAVALVAPAVVSNGRAFLYGRIAVFALIASSRA